MMKRRKTHGLEVMPIFCDVEPSVLKLETGVYRDALTQHKKERDPEIVQRWEEALKEVTGIKGWDTKDTGFISDIREASQGSRLLKLQRKLISDIIGNVGFKLSSIDDGINLIRDRFHQKKVLIFLDDVDDRQQLMAFAAKKEWFGPGSRIVVTTRDKRVLSGFQDQFECPLIYEVKELNIPAALQLFSKHAFGSNSPPNEFLSLSEEVIAKTGRLPLAIEVVGAFLCGQREAVWQDTLKKMEHFPQGGVEEKLMLSYNALDRKQQQIFLDIAWSLAGQYKRYAYYMWDDCGFFPNEGIAVLLSKSLVKIGEYDELWMHDQLKDLGRSIVYRENDNDPSKGSWVWEDLEDGPNFVQQKKGTATVAAIFEGSVLTSEDFIEMPRIRFLLMGGVTLSGDFKNVFSELKWLGWSCVPEDLQATNFFPKSLVILDLSWNSIDEHWGGWTQLKVATKLKFLDLEGCERLSKTPDLSAYVSLEILTLEFCRGLLRIDRSIRHLRRLKHLNLNGCSQLRVLPIELGSLKGLVELDVSHTSIAELPNAMVNLKNLKVLKMSSTSVCELPEAIGMLKNLEDIYGEYYEWLMMIPSDIVRLPFLKILKLTETRVENVPKLPQS